MSNPGPRPALRKAPDADLHPAEADKSRQAVVIDLAERSIELNDSPRPSRNNAFPSLAPTRPHRSTAAPSNGVPVPGEVQVVDEVPETGQRKSEERQTSKGRKSSKKKLKSQKKAEKKARKDATESAKRPKSKDTKNKKAKKLKKSKQLSAADLTGKPISDPRIALKSTVPRKTRQGMRAGAKARGTSLDDTVDSVVTDLRNR